MTGTRREVEKERLVSRLCFLIAYRRDRVVDHRVIQIKVLLLGYAYDLVVLGEERIELTVFSAEKTPEIVEAQRVRPAIKRPRRSLLRVRCKMPLADCGGVVAVALKNFRDGSRTRRPVGAIAGPPANQFGDGTEADCVVIPS